MNSVFHDILNSAHIGAITISREGFITKVNQAFLFMTDYSEEELIGAVFDGFIHPDWKGKLLSGELDSLRSPVNYRAGYITKSGETKYLKSTFCWDQQTHVMHVLFEDVDDRTYKLEKARHELELLSKINDSILYIKEEKKLLEEVCKVLVEQGRYKLAWVGYVNNTNEGSPILKPDFAFGEIDYLEGLVYDLSNPNVLMVPTGRAWETKELQWVNSIRQDPNCLLWQTKAHIYNLASAIVLPLNFRDGSEGMLCVFSNKPNAFDSDERRSMERIANNLSLGVYYLRIQQLKVMHEHEIEKKYHELKEYKNAIDEATIVSTTDANGIITHVSKSFCELSGYNSDEIVGKTHRLVSSGYHSKEFIKELWTTVKSGEIWRGEIKNKDKYGNEFWLNTVIIPVFDEFHNIKEYLAIREDITSRKLLEGKDKLFTAMVNSSVDAIITHDLRGNVLTWNNGAIQMFGWSADEIIGINKNKLIPEWLRDDDDKMIDRLLAGEQLEIYESTRINREGVPIDVSVAMSTILNDQGKIVGISKILRDITQVKNAERARQELQDQLKERLKENVLLQKVGNLLHTKDLTLTEYLKQVVQWIPAAFQFPEFTQASIDYKEQRFETHKYRSNPNTIHEDINLINNEHIRISVTVHHAPRTFIPEPFLHEELELIRLLGIMIQSAFNRNILFEEVKAKDANLNAILNNTNTIYLLLDHEFKIVTYNAAAESGFRDLFERPLKTGIDYINVVPDEHKIMSLYKLDELKKSGRIQYEIVHNTSNQDSLWFEKRIDAVYDENKTLLGYLYALRDITSFKIAAEEKNKQIERLRQMSHTVSHEIRHEFAKLKSIVDVVKEVDINDREISDILSYSDETFVKMDQAIRKLNDLIK
ncbi:MAG: PAS domain S-box protein [Bacteroidota bacterium]